MENNPQISSSQPNIPIISQEFSLDLNNGNYFIFANKVYNIDKVMTSHPGGYELIKSIRGREVDRYLYGSEPLESVDFQKVHSHTTDSIKLAGDPIAVLESVCPFTNMEDDNYVLLDNLIKSYNSDCIYVSYLKLSQKNFEYKGYSDLSQIGKYYALTISGTKTRLYTMVNFLHKSNIDLMSQITGSKYPEKKLFESQINSSLTCIEPMKGSNENYASQKNYSVPLLIKKYADGHLTKQFLSDSFKNQIKLSKPLGKGMGLNLLPNGKIIMFAAGTGLNPYCDLIDLLFKEMIVGLKNVHSQQIAKINPIINKRELTSKFSYRIYISVPSSSEIHQITSQQLDQLSRNKIIEVYLRTTTNSDNYFQQFKNINKLNKRFEECIADIGPEINTVSQIFVCGPPTMSRSLVKSFERFQVPSSKIRIMRFCLLLLDSFYFL